MYTQGQPNFIRENRKFIPTSLISDHSESKIENSEIKN